MSKWDKLLDKVCNLSKEVRFDELKKILETYGYNLDSNKGVGSHCTFRKKGHNPITIPKHKPIKQIYIKMVKQVIEREEENGKN